jgi:hypothetical protein
MKPGGILAGHDVDSPGVNAAVASLLHPIYKVSVSGRSWLAYIPENDIGGA